MSNKVVHFNSVGQLIDGLKTAYDSGDVKGLIVTFLTPDGFTYFNAQGLTHHEKVGMLMDGIQSVYNGLEEADE